MRIFSGKIIEFIYGDGIKDKLAILCFRIISSFYYRILRKRDFNPNQKTILKKLMKKRIVNISGVKYSLVDYESLLIVLPKFEQAIWKYLKPRRGEVFIDVGAHVGKYALQVARRVGDQGLVIAIEPNSENYQALLEGVQLNNLKNVISFNFAAWSQNCKLKIFLGDSSGHHTAKKNLGFDRFEVEAKTIDHIIEGLNITRVDWIKIDVEGAEFEVLKGLKKTLVKKHPKIIVEVFLKNLEDAENFLKENNYKITPMKGLNLRGKGVRGVDFNYLYCEPKIT